MKRTSIALAIGIMCLLAAWWGMATLRYYRSFTETAEGVVVRHEGREVVIRFHQERNSPAPHQTQFSGDAEYTFSLNDRTETLNVNVGDRVEAYHPPGRLATAFEETWAFQPVGTSTRVIRSFQLHAKSVLARPILWLIAFFLQKAIDRHLRQMRVHASS